jgi:hypothetical protein
MTSLLSHPTVIPTSTTSDWMHDRLTEARGVLADTTQHPESLVILVARVVVGQTDDARECGDALEVLPSAPSSKPCASPCPAMPSSTTASTR